MEAVGLFFVVQVVAQENFGQTRADHNGGTGEKPQPIFEFAFKFLHFLLLRARLDLGRFCQRIGSWQSSVQLPSVR